MKKLLTITIAIMLAMPQQALALRPMAGKHARGWKELMQVKGEYLKASMQDREVHVVYGEHDTNEMLKRFIEEIEPEFSANPEDALFLIEDKNGNAREVHAAVGFANKYGIPVEDTIVNYAEPSVAKRYLLEYPGLSWLKFYARSAVCMHREKNISLNEAAKDDSVLADINFSKLLQEAKKIMRSIESDGQFAAEFEQSFDEMLEKITPITNALQAGVGSSSIL